MLRFVQTNKPTLARQGDGLGYIRIWAAPPSRLVFWDGASSSYKWYQSHTLNLSCVQEPPRVDGIVLGASAGAGTGAVKDTVQHSEKVQAQVQ